MTNQTTEVRDYKAYAVGGDAIFVNFRPELRPKEYEEGKKVEFTIDNLRVRGTMQKGAEDQALIELVETLGKGNRYVFEICVEDTVYFPNEFVEYVRGIKWSGGSDAIQDDSDNYLTDITGFEDFYFWSYS